MSIDTRPAPLDIDDVLDPAWLSAALAVQFPGAAVAATEVIESVTTVATKVRFRATFDESAGAPTDLFVKGYFAEPGRSRPSMGAKEAKFYERLAARIPIRVPRALYIGEDPSTEHALVVMDDLVAAGCTFLTALEPYSPERADATLDQLARLHAATWGGAELAGESWLTSSLDSILAHVTSETLQEQLGDSRGDGLPGEILQAERLRAAVKILASGEQCGAPCLVHGDAHAGNLYVDANGDPGIVDWQILQIGGWALDVAYHVGAVLTVDDRRDQEQDLLRSYLDRLGSLGVEPPEWDEAWHAYRCAFAYGLYLWGITHRVVRPVIDTFTNRLGTAVADHGSLDLLGV